MNTKNRLTYKPPQAIDLSATSVSEGRSGPQGTCISGTTPYEACSEGLLPNTTCSPGTTPGINPPCPLGPGPGGPTCNPVGSRAASICIVGSAQN